MLFLQGNEELASKLTNKKILILIGTPYLVDFIKEAL